MIPAHGARPIDQLRLAMKWNRSDVAADKLFTNESFTDDEKEQVMMEALISNKVQFFPKFFV